MTPSKNAVSQPSRVIVVRIELTPVAKTQSVAVADRFGMTQIASLSRLIEWFASQPEPIQATVLTEGAAATMPGDAAYSILERMARSSCSS